MAGDETVAPKLREIVVEYEGRGVDLSSEPRLAEAVLLDLFPEATAEVNALVESIRSGAIESLRDRAAQGAEFSIEGSAAHLAESAGLREDLARSALESWWVALSLGDPPTWQADAAALSATVTAAPGRRWDPIPQGVTPAELGEHRPQDLDTPEHVFEPEADGRPSELPPLRYLENPKMGDNLPGQLTTFIGRSRELEEISALLRHGSLVCLTGAGGSGKTRLALQVAADLLDGSGGGVWFIDLAALSDPDLVAAAVASALKVREQPGRPVLETLVDSIGDQRLLVVLDNCEHLLDGCAKFADAVLRACPGVHILATSRQPLGIAGEQVYRVPPLTLPADEADASSSEAVALFVERATEHRREFVLDDGNARAVVSICRHLDGIPLAIELATARLRSMDVQEIEVRLDRRFRLLTRGSRTAVARHQTLSSLISWSYDLLDESERVVFCRLSVFAGGWDLDAAEAVCAGKDTEIWEVDDVLASLIDKSLVQTETTQMGLRYRLLESIRQYAAEQLGSRGEPELASARTRHAEFYTALAEEAALHLRGPKQAEWLARLESEHDNLRVTMSQLLESPETREEVLRLAVALRDFWVSRGYYREGAELLEAALEMPGESKPGGLRAAALHASGSMLFNLGAFPAARARLEEAVAIARSASDHRLIVRCLQLLGAILYKRGDYAAAGAIFDEEVSAARASGDADLVAWALATRARVTGHDDPDRARAEFGQALDHFRAAGNSGRTASTLEGLGLAELMAGNPRVARRCFEEARAISLEAHDDDRLQYDLQNLALAALLLEEPLVAAELTINSLAVAQRIGSDDQRVYSLLTAALCASRIGEAERSAQLHGAADALLGKRGENFEPLEARLREADHVQVRREMGDEAFEAAYEAGRRLKVSDAVALALRVDYSGGT